MSEEKVEQGVIHGFDYRSIIRDPKTGKTIKEQHYIRHVSQSEGEYLERDGKFFSPNGVEIPNPKAPVIQATESKTEKKPEVSFSKKA